MRCGSCAWLSETNCMLCMCAAVRSQLPVVVKEVERVEVKTQASIWALLSAATAGARAMACCCVHTQHTITISTNQIVRTRLF